MKSSSVADAKRVYNMTNESINALKVLNKPVQHCDSILLFTMKNKLFVDSHTLWYREKKANEPATFQQFLEFLEGRVFELENTQKSTSHVTHQGDNNYKRNQARSLTAVVQSCPVCTKEHFLYSCDQFKQLDVKARRRVVQHSSICFNSLKPNHQAASCKNSSCRKCNGRHNTLLHADEAASDQQQNRESSNPAQHSEVTCISVNSQQQRQCSVTLLPTAMLMVKDAFNVLHPCRALLDSGSQGTLISESCAQRLQLIRRFDRTMLYGVGSSKGNCTRGKVHLSIKPKQGNTTIGVDALCLANLTQSVPNCEVTHQKLTNFKPLELADQWYFKHGKIYIILGADAFTDCILPEKLTHPSGSPTALKTIFGWVLLGVVPGPTEEHIITAHTLLDLSKQLQSFWVVEELSGPEQHSTPDEKKAEDHYKQTVKRTDSGRYVVRLPLRNDEVKLCNSRVAAVHRLSAMERRFDNDARLQEEYLKFLTEYEKLGHMAPSTDSIPGKVYFLPHHAVLKSNSTTTKLRVVFDASCKSTNGQSLNNNLVVGPTTQRFLFEIVIFLRKYEIGFSADIEKMYRQILVHPDDRSLQRILWRGSKDQCINEYDLQTVTYGTSAAPFLAIRTLQQIAIDNQDEYPEAATAIKRDFYVDDIMSCATRVCAAEKLKNELCGILLQAGFHLRKWSSNSSKFLEGIVRQDCEVSSDTVIYTTQTVKTLGLLWDTSNDTFKYSVTLPTLTPAVTKRAVFPV